MLRRAPADAQRYAELCRPQKDEADMQFRRSNRLHRIRKKRPQATSSLGHGGSMRKTASIGLAILVCIGLAKLGPAQSTDPISGEWLITREVFGNTQFHKVTLKLENGKVTGAFASGKKLEGRLQGNALHFIARDGFSTIECTGTVSGGKISGKFLETFTSDPKEVLDNPITATRMPAPRSGPPQRHEFRPTIFYREFSASPSPVLRIWPGDTVHTT